MLDQKISSLAASKVTGSLIADQFTDNAVLDQKISSVSANKVTGSLVDGQILNLGSTEELSSYVITTSGDFMGPLNIVNTIKTVDSKFGELDILSITYTDGTEIGVDTLGTSYNVADFIQALDDKISYGNVVYPSTLSDTDFSSLSFHKLEFFIDSLCSTRLTVSSNPLVINAAQSNHPLDLYYADIQCRSVCDPVSISSTVAQTIYYKLDGGSCTSFAGSSDSCLSAISYCQYLITN